MKKIAAYLGYRPQIYKKIKTNNKVGEQIIDIKFIPISSPED